MLGKTRDICFWCSGEREFVNRRLWDCDELLPKLLRLYSASSRPLDNMEQFQFDYFTGFRDTGVLEGEYTHPHSVTH